MSRRPYYLLSVGELDPTRIGPGWWAWLAERGAHPVFVNEFLDGELQLRLPTVDDHVDVFCDFRAPTTHRFDMQQVLHVCAVARAAKQHGAAAIRLLTPELPCMRQDRPIRRMDSVELGARDLILDLLAIAGVQTICSSYMKFDLSSSPLELRFPNEHDVATWFVGSRHFPYRVVVALDQGGTGLAAAVARVAQVPTITLDKRRSDTGVDHNTLTAEIRNALATAGSALIVDDLLVSGQSLWSAATAIIDSGTVGDLDAFVWHVRPCKSDLSVVGQLQTSGVIGSLMTSNLAPGFPGATILPADPLLTSLVEAS